MDVDWRIYQAFPDYNPKYDPQYYMHIKELEYQAYEEITREYMLDDMNAKIPKYNPDCVDIIIRDYREDCLYKKIGDINILDQGVRLAYFEPEKLDILAGTNYIVYYRLSDIYNMKTKANMEPDGYEQNRYMVNIYFYMYRIAERNNKILAKLKN